MITGGYFLPFGLIGDVDLLPCKLFNIIASDFYFLETLGLNLP